jgi:hypothetical protein
MTTVRALDLTVAATDGHGWVMQARVPETPTAALLWLPALGVAARHYLPFAEVMASNGVACFVHEWRGAGSSTLRAGRGCDWGYRELLALDLPASEAMVEHEVPGVARILGGHSLGGQLACCRLALAPDAAPALWLVASGAPYWRSFPRRTRWWLPMAYRFLPWLAARAGALPGRTIRFGGQEARGVMNDADQPSTSPIAWPRAPAAASAARAARRATGRVVGRPGGAERGAARAAGRTGARSRARSSRRRCTRRSRRSCAARRKAGPAGPAGRITAAAVPTPARAAGRRRGRHPARAQSDERSPLGAPGERASKPAGSRTSQPQGSPVRQPARLQVVGGGGERVGHAADQVAPAVAVEVDRGLEEGAGHELRVAEGAGPGAGEPARLDVAVGEDAQRRDQLAAEERLAPALAGQRRERAHHQRRLPKRLPKLLSTPQTATTVCRIDAVARLDTRPACRPLREHRAAVGDALASTRPAR